MHKCKICLREYKKIKFHSERISICGICVNTLNNYNHSAEFAHNTLRERLLNNILTKATIDVSDSNLILSVSREREIERIMENPHQVVDSIFPEWLNKKTISSDENSPEIKIIRAYRRGLIHYDTPNRFGRTNQWDSISKAIKISDKMTCCMCRSTGVELDTHHIVWVRNFGTNQKTNLITLCRKCHEKVHERKFNFIMGEHLHDDVEINKLGILPLQLIWISNIKEQPVDKNQNKQNYLCLTNKEYDDSNLIKKSQSVPNKKEEENSILDMIIFSLNLITISIIIFIFLAWCLYGFFLFIKGEDF